jgi:hypothetical protein
MNHALRAAAAKHKMVCNHFLLHKHIQIFNSGQPLLLNPAKISLGNRLFLLRLFHTPNGVEELRENLNMIVCRFLVDTLLSEETVRYRRPHNTTPED